MSYNEAKKIYAHFGVDTERALERLAAIPVSMHCWQGDDVIGFDGSAALDGGIQTTGNYPGRARNKEELVADLTEALSLVPGKKRINLHASYAVKSDGRDRDELEPRDFDYWIGLAKKNGWGIDFNPTFFSHPKVKDGLTLSSPDEETRAFWVRHGKACRKISAYIGEKLGTSCLCNIWIPDGYKNMPADRLAPRLRLKKSLDEIYSVKYDEKYIIDSVESKVFGIGLESYTVGSAEFYMNYAMQNGICCLLDNGHFHPTENVADKIPSLLAFCPYVALHVTKPVRWDSDHVVMFEDDIRDVAKEIVRDGNESRVLIGLDYFDASINRVAAWALGARNMQRALLSQLLMPWQTLKEAQEKGDFTYLIALTEELKTAPLGDVWQEYLSRQNVAGAEWIDEVKRYEREVLAKRS